ncbi:outer membrane chaperone Skp [Caulobacter sp. CCUG 60055]|uniref:OmpH family outer membrane protein n=2 Tax=Pseudomonadota TaxID=1224 RepID=UPI001FA7AE4E|nr:OmpH family outer membrane protein [Caulobacter sp. CCUG 60055]MBQ1540597.1 OmpH family outer membrane protein [Caulobacteraceae bacterium]MCI3178840.1 outer membrane chaperone Skp [Caulobacter sp. CCUG 60055]
MTLKQLGVSAAAAAAALSFASMANAQAAKPAAAPAAAAPAPAAAAGPSIPGVCILSNERAIGTSTVGKYVIQRMQTITSQVNAELNGEKTSIDTEAKSLDGQRATLGQEAYEQKGLALRQRANGLERKAQIRQRELEVTEQKALARVGQEMDPIVKAVYAQRNCALLIDRNSLFGASASMDITDAVVAQLNGKITQFAFDRERLDQQPAQPQPAAGAAKPK